MGEGKYGISPKTLQQIAQEVRDIVGMGVEVGIVIGGGNIFRGVSASTEGMDRASADYMGMLATVINALALQDSLEKLSVYTRVQSAIDMQQLAEPYIRFDLGQRGNIIRVVQGEDVGTLVGTLKPQQQEA